MNNITDEHRQLQRGASLYLRNSEQVKELGDLSQQVKEKKQELEMVNMEMISDTLPLVWDMVSDLKVNVDQANGEMKQRFEQYQEAIDSNEEYKVIDVLSNAYKRAMLNYTDMVKALMGVLKELGIKDVVAKNKVTNINNGGIKLSNRSPYRRSKKKRQETIDIKPIDNLN